MWFILIIIVIGAITGISIIVSRNKKDTFSKLHTQYLSELQENNTKVKSFYYGVNTVFFAQENIPTLYVLNSKLEFQSFDLTGIDFYRHHITDLFLYRYLGGSEWLAEEKFSHIEMTRSFGEFSNIIFDDELDKLISFTGAHTRSPRLTSRIAYDEGDIYMNYSKGLFSIETIAIRHASVINEIHWNIGPEEHKYSVKKGRSGAGGAIVGGLLFGTTGAVVGGLFRRKDDEIIEGNAYINKAFVDISLTNGNPDLRVWFVSKPAERYQKKIDTMQNFVDTLYKMANANAKLQLSDLLSQPSDYSLVVQGRLEVIDFLLEQQVINQEEYDNRRKNIIEEN